MLDGSIVPFDEIEKDMGKGLDMGAVRAVLSGGEPTIHPDFIRIVETARRLGYKEVQTVSNGRMFSSKTFFNDAVNAGLGEITFSIHGHKKEIHETLTNAEGSFKQTMTGLIRAVKQPGLIVNIDIVLNRINVPYLPEMIGSFSKLGIYEYDLLHLVPFGSTWKNADRLFYDIEDYREQFDKVFEIAGSPSFHIWTNRLPPRNLERHPHLIQSPVKLYDEVRGRKDSFSKLLFEGEDFFCRDERCSHCFIRGLCEYIKDISDLLPGGSFKYIKADTTDIINGIDLPYGVESLYLNCPDGEQLSRVVSRLPELERVYLELESNNFEQQHFSELTEKGSDVFVVCHERPILEQALSMDSIQILAEINRDNIEVGKSSGNITWFFARDSDANFIEFIKMTDDRKPEILNLPECVLTDGSELLPLFVPIKVLEIIKMGNINIQDVLDSIVSCYIDYGYFTKFTGCSDCKNQGKCTGFHVNTLLLYVEGKSK